MARRKRFATIIWSLVLGAACAAQAQSSKTSPPCGLETPFRQQDFTIGAWEVFGKDKAKSSAIVEIKPVLGGCALEEIWTVTDGRPTANGRGLFTYSRQLGVWHYLWAADTGSSTEFKGRQTSPNTLVYETSASTKNGGKRQRRWTLSLEPDGWVRELSVASEDEGATWLVEYDLFWRRRP